MNDEQKRGLFPYFAFTYSRKEQPAKYGGTSTFDDWYTLIKEDVPFLDEITESALKLTDDEWSELEKDYQAEQVQEAAKGAKLNNLKKLRATKKKSKKCGCGCDLVSVQEKGGKIVIRCGCGCKQ